MTTYTAPPRSPGSLTEFSERYHDSDTTQAYGAWCVALTEHRELLAKYHRTDPETLHRAHFDYSQNPPRVILGS